MKVASSGLISLLGSQQQLIYADLWAFNLRNGANVYYTDWDTDLTVGGITYVHNDVLITGGKIKQTRGLEVNETDLTCYPNLINAPSSINIVSGGAPTVPQPFGLLNLEYSGAVVSGVPFLQACVDGLFDRCIAQRSRIFMPTPGNTSLGAVRIFYGEVTDVEVTRNMATIKCKDMTNLLNIQMPRRQFQPTCPWTFGDTNCTFPKSSLTVSSSVAAGSSNTTINCGLAQAPGYFNYGNVFMTSGVNAGISRTVKSYAPGVITMTGAFPQPMSVGDAFTITPGCSKNLSAATQMFNAAAIAGASSSVFYTTLSNISGFFNGGSLQFTSGANAGLVSTITSWVQQGGNGIATCSPPFPNGATAGDQMTLTAVSTNTTCTCTGYNNTQNFGGQPYVPIPETAW